MADGHRIGTLFAELDLDAAKLTKKQKEIFNDAKQVTEGIEKNYSNLGIKSAAMFDALRQRAVNAYEGIKNSARSTADDRLRAEQALTSRLKQLHEEQYGKSISIIKTLKDNWLGLTAAIYGAYASMQKGIAGLEGIYAAGVKASQLKLALGEISGSAELAAGELDFLRQISDKLGQNFWELVDSYKGVLAASKATNLAGQETRNIFEAVMKASTTLGLSSERTKLTLYAVEQMMSKGKVSSEELRRQMGDLLPGAFSLAAKAMNMTTQEFDKQLKAGTIFSDDFLPKFARALDAKYSGKVNEAMRATNKWKEAVIDLKVSMSESGFLDSAADAIKQITDAIKDQSFQTSMADFAKNIGEVAKSLSSVAKYAGLRSITGTLEQAAQLAKQGQLGMSLKEFASKTFFERQHIVDVMSRPDSDIKNKVRGKIPKGFSDIETNEKSWYQVEKEASETIKKIEKELNYFFGEQDSILSNVDKGLFEYFNDIDKAEKQLKEKRIKTLEDFNLKYEEIGLNQYEMDRLQIERQAQLWLDAGGDKLKVAEYTAQQMRAIDEKMFKDMEKNGTDTFEELGKQIQGWGRTSAKAITDFALKGTSSFGEMIESMISDMVEMFVYQQLMAPMFNMMGAYFGGGANAVMASSPGAGGASMLLPTHDSGGPVSAGRSYFVGTGAQPELFTPGTSGVMTPADKLGGSNTINIFNNVGADVKTSERKTSGGIELDVMIDQAVASKLNKMGSASNKALTQRGVAPQITRR